ncbi:MAG: hypothetical protein OXP69_19165 [Spirochaetaceae bacterium]|nr:hypothetical protein [Spirochaetaceae bacterium]
MSDRARAQLDLARDILGLTTGRPRQIVLKRAISNAYYALFHCLAESNANMLVGGPNSDRSDPAWIQAYRALVHRKAKDKFRKQDPMRRFPKELRQFADEFCEAQLQREEAEYNPASRFALQEVEWRLMSVEQAITDFLTVPKKHRRAFAIYLLTEFRK